MASRHASGYPLRNSKARAMDVVARLSGVNFGSVEKVFAAIEALHRTHNWDPRDVINMHNCPSVPAHADASAVGRERLNATEEVIAGVLKAEHKLGPVSSAVLHLSGRFNLDGTGKHTETIGD